MSSTRSAVCRRLVDGLVRALHVLRTLQHQVVAVHAQDAVGHHAWNSNIMFVNTYSDIL